MTERPKSPRTEGTTLKDLSKHLGLTKGTVSAVLNDSPYAKAIPQHTKDRIFAAAQEMNYQPNFFARTLRKKRTHTVGVICAEIGDAYGSVVISGIEEALSERKYFFVTVVHHHNDQLMNQYSDILKNRGSEGFITIDTTLSAVPQLPTVAVSGHREIEGVTNITLDHTKAAKIVLGHLHQLGHTFGLAHCSEPKCAMSLATHIDLVDAKAEQYCARCGLRLVQRFTSLGGEV